MVKSHAPNPPDDVMESLFADAPMSIREPDLEADAKTKAMPAASASALSQEVKRMSTWYAEINKVMDKDGVGHTPQAEAELASQVPLLRYLHQHNLWHKVDDARASSLLPELALVRRKCDARCFFVEKAFAFIVVLWPAVRQDLGIWKRDPDVQKLDFEIVFKLDDWEEIPIQYTCPLGLYMEDRAMRMSICYTPQGICQCIFVHSGGDVDTGSCYRWYGDRYLISTMLKPYSISTQAV